MEIKYGRKRSGIKRELTKKVDDWLSTIKNVDVQTMARKDVIVTGGSIASMLLGEKINDFDVYFRTFETAKAVAHYYVDQFNSTVKLKTNNNYKPEVRVEEIENCKGEEETRIIIWMQSAGVAAENQKQYNYFESLSEEETIEFAESLAHEMNDDSKKEKYRPVFMSANAITLSHKMQLVTRFYGSPEEIHNNYDFQHAMCYWDHENKELNIPAEALECMLSRTLVYRGSLYPVASIFRMKKFIERGWRITAGQQLKIMWQISELDMKDQTVIREQLTGVDLAYMHQLIQAVKDLNAEKINSSYIGAIIDKIFD